MLGFKVGSVWVASATSGLVALAGVALIANVASGANSSSGTAAAAGKPTASPNNNGNGNGAGNGGVGNGNGNGNGGTGVPVQVSGDPVTGLAPGIRKLVYVTVSTANGSGGTVRSVTGRVGAASVPTTTACAWQDIVVEGFDATSSPAAFPLSASSPARVPVYVTMRNTTANQDRCKNLTATITYTATAQG